MENAVEALKMAFAVMVFVIALSLTIMIFSKARQTSEIVLQSSDKTAYYEYDTTKGTKFENRVVGLETIIPTLYKYSKENYKVVFKKGNYIDGEVKNLENLEIYETTTTVNLWTNYKNDFNDDKNSKKIHSFDIVEETQRKEPWVGNDQEVKKNLDAIFSGGKYEYPDGTRKKIEYNTILSEKNKKYVELIGRKSIDTNVTDDITGVKKTNKKTKIIITYVLIN